jgi:hypothetical protein
MLVDSVETTTATEITLHIEEAYFLSLARLPQNAFDQFLWIIKYAKQLTDFKVNKPLELF